MKIDKIDKTGSGNVIDFPMDALVRSIAINRRISHSIFLGAGASVSSGMPSAYHCILEWKKAIFVSNNPSLAAEVSEISLSSVQRRIQKWIDQQGAYPKENSTDEYSAFIQACYPLPNDRREYFKGHVASSKPSTGYKLLCLLAAEGLIPSVWTTNFDGLTARAAASTNLTPIEIGIDCQTRIFRPQQSGEIVCVSLHGDYRYDALKNTETELQDQEANLVQAASLQIQNNPLIVIGYSGRDSSVMKALADAYSIQGAGTLYWCGYGEAGLTPQVTALIQHARQHGRQAHYVPTNGFDDLMIRLSQVLLAGEKLEIAKTYIDSGEKITEKRDPFRLPNLPTIGVVKGNAFPISLPNELLQFSVNNLPEKGVWKHLQEVVGARDLVVAPSRGKVLAFGTAEEVTKVFSGSLSGTVERTPLEKRDLHFEDGTITSMLRTMFVKSAASTNNLSHDGKRKLWEKEAYELRKIDNKEIRVHRAAIIYFRLLNNSPHLVIKPSIHVLYSDGREVEVEIQRNIKLQIFGYQHNNKFDAEIKHWADILCGKQYFYPNSSVAGNFKIKLEQAPIFAKIGQNHAKYPITLEDKFKKHITQSGVLLNDVPVTFTNKAGDAICKDVHPLRGLVNNRPSDYALTQSRLADTINIGVVCPPEDSADLEKFLFSLLQPRCVANEAKEDYLLPYPGFQQAYGVSLVLPNKETPKWVHPGEPDKAMPQLSGLQDLANRLIRSVETVAALISSPVVVIYIPQRWFPWFEYADEIQHVDLHDYVKAACAQKGIATQFLRWQTLGNPDKARVNWWLSLAVYAKSMRTPWRLDCLEDDTAYIGLGYSVDSHARKGQHILLGCSHLYSNRGEGLQFRLNKIDNPIYRYGKPFLSEDDARKVGENIRQLFFDARCKLPNRVVIHKRTPFIESERAGLEKGLRGVAELDLIEINIDDSIRYVASKPKREGGFEIDSFPVGRGTVIPIDDYTALLWVHGSSIHVSNDRFKYYKGKRRIPAPLVIRRYAGSRDLTTICREILGLSKMNWNAFDLYAQLPATIDSSNKIAKIGSLLSRFSTQSYDYRLFI